MNRELQPDTPENRIANALSVAKAGGFDGSHHKMWVIDQMIRYLTGSQAAGKTGMAVATTEYDEWVRAYQSGEDGTETYLWDVGIAP